MESKIVKTNYHFVFNTIIKFNDTNKNEKKSELTTDSNCSCPFYFQNFINFLM